MLTTGRLDYIAVTDHNTIEMAVLIKKTLGDHIIVGEEITTTEGEIVGLYLQEKVPPGLSAAETAQRIHDQGGLVYIPHPFETVRKGIPTRVLDAIAHEVDIIETHNGRAVFQNKSRQATDWGTGHHVPGASASDAHGIYGWGRTYTALTSTPSRQSLVQLLGGAEHHHRWPGVMGLLYPKFNRMRKHTKNV